jgi:hypothetical protein
MSKLTRSVAAAAILFFAASSAASAAIPDITAAQSNYVVDVSGPAVIASDIDLTAPSDRKPVTWVMLILGIAHLGVGLRYRAAALRLARSVPGRTRRKKAAARWN